jgi:UDP-N-acetylmuramoyl-tripeptide--D-alanyl-D-alanine ligase
MMRLGQIIRAISGRASGAVADREVRGVSTDTRTLRAGEIYFALKGPRFDGHGFVPEAFARGAGAAVVERAGGSPGGLEIVVADAGAALEALAAAWRMTLRARVVGVTGSNGKTTTKEMIGHILSKDRRVVRSQGSFNNSVGLPLTLFGAGPEDEVLVLEIGSNHPGEIAHLGRIARPDAAVITSVGASHLEGLGTVEGVADEKASLLGCLRGGGFAVVHDHPLLLSRVSLPPEKVITFGMSREADLRPEGLEPLPEGKGMRYSVRGVKFRLGLLGDWNVLNSLAAAATAMSYGVTLPECAWRLADFKPPKMRMERLDLAGVTVINDAYNSNPESASRAVREFSRLTSAGRKVAVIGDMLELGPASEEYHRRLGAVLSECAVDVVAGVGPLCRALLEAVGGSREKLGFESVDEVRPRMDDLFRPGDLVLLKGSRGMGLERLVKWLGERVA